MYEGLYHLVHPLLGAVARNRWLIARLFHVNIPRRLDVHFDPTTLLLRHALLRVVRANDRTALELGIGQGALLAIGLQRETSLTVHGVDCSETRVLSSRSVADHNGVESRFYVSDLFSNVPEEQQFDLIFFNPPYVPTQQGRRLQLTTRMHADSDCVWDGGDDGQQILRRFLRDARHYLAPHGRLLFGTQPVFVPVQDTESMISEAGWHIVERITRRGLPSIVFVTRPG